MRTPGLAVASVMTIAMAIAVNTAVFSLVNLVVFADLPMKNPDRVAIIWSANPAQSVFRNRLSAEEFLAIQRETRSFSPVAAIRDVEWIRTEIAIPARVAGSQITPSLFDAWEISPLLGRPFLPEDARPTSPPVAILSHGYWQRSFGGRPDVLGASIRLDGLEHAIVGVMSPGVEMAELADAEVWAPLVLDRTAEDRDRRDLLVWGLLREGKKPEQAIEEVGRIGMRISEAHPGSRQGWTLQAQMTREGLLDDENKTVLSLLFLSVGFVLLIACANVANMLLVRATARSGEFAIRTALGASRSRVIRQVLIENSLIALPSALLGLLMAWGLLEFLVWLTRGAVAIFLLATLDLRVLLFTLLVALLSLFAFGLFPALSASRTEVVDPLKGGSTRSGRNRREGKILRTLAVVQISLALMAMAVTGLISRSIANIHRQELGFDLEEILSFRLDVPESKYGDEDALLEFSRDVLAGLRGTTGVAGVEMASFIPAVQEGILKPLQIEGRAVSDQGHQASVRLNRVSAEFFGFLGIPTLDGRTFSEGDQKNSVSVALISNAVATRYWPGGNAVGSRVRLAEGEWIQVIGVVGDVKAASSLRGAPEVQLYLPFQQAPSTGMLFMVRPEPGMKLEPLVQDVRGAIRSVDPDQPVDYVQTLEEAVFDARAGAYAVETLFLAFSLFALAMAGVGIYGVLSYSVGRRAREISLRRALGAETREVRDMVLWDGMKLLILGGLMGLGGAFLIGQLLGSVLVGVTATDPLTFVGATVVLASVIFFANFLPAHKATSIEPMEILRTD